MGSLGGLDLVAAPSMYLWLTVLAGLASVAWSLLRTYFPYLRDDCVFMLRSVRLGIRLSRYKLLRPFYSLLDCFLDAARRHPDKTFLHFEGRRFSYGDVDRQSSRVARVLQAEARLREGDAVALFLANEPSFVWTWLALAKLGCPAALLNFNIRSKSLLHCFSCCGAKVLVTCAGEMLTDTDLSPFLTELSATYTPLTPLTPPPPPRTTGTKPSTLCLNICLLTSPCLHTFFT